MQLFNQNRSEFFVLFLFGMSPNQVHCGHNTMLESLALSLPWYSTYQGILKYLISNILWMFHSLLTIEDLLVPTLFPLFMGVQLASNILFYENKIKWVSYVYICLLPSMFLDTDPCPLSKDSMTVFWKSYLSFDLIW